METPTEREILIHLLRVGNDAPSNIAPVINRTPEYVSDRLPKLEERGLVTNRGSGVWSLTVEGLEAARVYQREEL